MEYFQDYMPGNLCFGCGAQNPAGLQIKSYWEEDLSVCIWKPEERYLGWKGLLNGGILATLIDCHCMGTAMAAAYKEEGRDLGSEPHYRYATGTISVKYLKPTSLTHAVLLKAWVTEIKGRKTTLRCEAWSEDICTAEGDVIAIRVADTRVSDPANPFTH